MLVCITNARPNSVPDKIVVCIQELRTPAGSGSSRQVLAKLLKEHWAISSSVALKKALQKGIDTGKLLKDKAAFKVADDNPHGCSQQELNLKPCEAWHCVHAPTGVVRELLNAGANMDA